MDAMGFDRHGDRASTGISVRSPSLFCKCWQIVTWIYIFERRMPIHASLKPAPSNNCDIRRRDRRCATQRGDRKWGGFSRAVGVEA